MQYAAGFQPAHLAYFRIGDRKRDIGLAHEAKSVHEWEFATVARNQSFT